MESQAPSAQRVCILGADEHFAGLCLMLLESEGVECVRAESPADLPPLLIQHPIDLVVMGLRKEWLFNPLEFLEALRTTGGHNSAVPVVVCTASRELIAKHQQRLDELGASIVEKPFEIDDLVDLIVHLLHSPAWPLAADGSPIHHVLAPQLRELDWTPIEVPT